MNKKLNILVCPLNWGLGHASRDIQVIKNLLKQNFNVVVAGSESTNALIKSEFQSLKYINFEGINIKYPLKSSFFLYFLLRIPKLFFIIIKEHFELSKIINAENINVVISANRFGLWNKNIYCIFITHQTKIKIPLKSKLLSNFVNWVNTYFINKYNKCWIPDYNTLPNYSGDLSHKIILNNSIFIGLLSKFEKEAIKKVSYKYEFVAIISGPEPHRSAFEKIIRKQLIEINVPSVIIIGKPKENTNLVEKNVEIFSHLNTNSMYNVINNSRYVISRSGYSTIMDLIKLNKPAILVPTPNQTEQEYLATWLCNIKMFYFTEQYKLNLKEDIKKIDENFKITKKSDNLLESEIYNLNNLM